MYVWVLDIGDFACYPPCGFRVQVCKDLATLIEDVMEFFGEIEGRDVAFLKAKNEYEVSVVIQEFAGKRSWSLIRVENGEYIYPEG